MVAVHPGMQDQTNTNIARDGAAKKTQTKFATTHGMKNRIDGSSLSASPDHPGWGPDADPANPMAPEPKVKTQYAVKSAWGMRDANGQSVNGELGTRVLTEAAHLGRG